MTTCTAKVIADLESVNAYHRGIMQDASNAFEEGIQSPQRHTINLIELRQARQEALSLPIHSDYDILLLAEEQCRPSVIRANFLFGDSFRNHSDIHENDLLD